MKSAWAWVGVVKVRRMRVRVRVRVQRWWKVRAAMVVGCIE